MGCWRKAEECALHVGKVVSESVACYSTLHGLAICMVAIGRRDHLYWQKPGPRSTPRGVVRLPPVVPKAPLFATCKVLQ